MASYSKSKFLSPEGIVFDSYEDYCNWPDLDMDLIQVKLWKGERIPQNGFERALLKDIEAAKREGKVFEIYPN